jgi:hypothetical protein
MRYTVVMHGDLFTIFQLSKITTGMADAKGDGWRTPPPPRFCQIRKKRRQGRCTSLLLATPDFQTFPHPCQMPLPSKKITGATQAKS